MIQALVRGRYRIEELLGRGAMSDVYRAFDLRRQVSVAIKFLREDLVEDPEFMARFAREAEALARLEERGLDLTPTDADMGTTVIKSAYSLP